MSPTRVQLDHKAGPALDDCPKPANHYKVDKYNVFPGTQASVASSTPLQKCRLLARLLCTYLHHCTGCHDVTGLPLESPLPPSPSHQRAPAAEADTESDGSFQSQPPSLRPPSTHSDPQAGFHSPSLSSCAEYLFLTLVKN